MADKRSAENGDESEPQAKSAKVDASTSRSSTTSNEEGEFFMSWRPAVSQLKVKVAKLNVLSAITPGVSLPDFI